MYIYIYIYKVMQDSYHLQPNCTGSLVRVLPAEVCKSHGFDLRPLGSSFLEFQVSGQSRDMALSRWPISKEGHTDSQEKAPPTKAKLSQ